MRFMSVLLICSCVQVVAGDTPNSPMEGDAPATTKRPVMSPMEASPDDDESVIHSLFVAISQDCNGKELDSFLNHFTPDRAKSIRERMRKAISNGMEMQIVGLELKENKGNRATASVEYRWEIPGQNAEITTSTFGLIRTDGGWRVSSEKVMSSVPIALSLSAEEDASGFKPPLGVKWTPGNCAGGRCETTP